MIYAQIKDGVISNTIVADEETPLSLFAEGFDSLVRVDELSPRPGPGWTYDGAHFSAPAVEVAPIADVTPRQIRQALTLMGVSMASIAAALASLPEPQRSLAQIEWEYSIAFQRHRPLVESVGLMLGWDSAQLDALWRFAASL